MNHLKNKLCLISCMMMSAFLTAQQLSDARIGKAPGLVGEWKIDLRPTPDSEAYYQVFEIDSVEDNVLTGLFYGSPIENGLINTSWPETHFAFTTADATHTYYHSGFLKDATLFGTTYCPGRKLVAKWTGRQSP